MLLLLLDFLFNDIPELIGEKFCEWCKAFFDGKIHFAFLDVKWVPFWKSSIVKVITCRNGLNVTEIPAHLIVAGEPLVVEPENKF